MKSEDDSSQNSTCSLYFVLLKKYFQWWQISLAHILWMYLFVLVKAEFYHIQGNNFIPLLDITVQDLQNIASAVSCSL